MARANARAQGESKEQQAATGSASGDASAALLAFLQKKDEVCRRDCARPPPRDVARVASQAPAAAHVDICASLKSANLEGLPSDLLPRRRPARRGDAWAPCRVRASRRSSDLVDELASEVAKLRKRGIEKGFVCVKLSKWLPQHLAGALRDADEDEAKLSEDLKNLAQARSFPERRVLHEGNNAGGNGGDVEAQACLADAQPVAPRVEPLRGWCPRHGPAELRRSRSPSRRLHGGGPRGCPLQAAGAARGLLRRAGPQRLGRTLALGRLVLRGPYALLWYVCFRVALAPSGARRWIARQSAWILLSWAAPRRLAMPMKPRPRRRRLRRAPRAAPREPTRAERVRRSTGATAPAGGGPGTRAALARADPAGAKGSSARGHSGTSSGSQGRRHVQ